MDLARFGRVLGVVLLCMSALPAAAEPVRPWAPDQDHPLVPPPVREQVSLNGMWTFEYSRGGEAVARRLPVPEYWDAEGVGIEADRGVYRRTVEVPAAWEGRRVALEFEGVSQMAEVSVDSVRLYRHVGAWVEFSVDVTDHVAPGEPFELAVEVWGGNRPPIVDEAGRPLWPVGWYGHEWGWGICHPVWLRAYGRPVSVRDVHIKPRWEGDEGGRELELNYTLWQEGEDRVRTEMLVEVFDAADVGELGPDEKPESKPVFTYREDLGQLRRGGEQSVALTLPWPEDVELEPWWPDAPHLYVLRTTLLVDGQPVDREQRRFGFREVGIDGNHYTLNGVPLWLRGDSIITHSQSRLKRDHRNALIGPDTWPDTIDALKSLNFNVVRFHQSPPPDWAIDMCDAKGLMVIDESAAYARPYVRGVDRDLYLANAQRWSVPWVRGHRNHPSIVLWSAENELGRQYLRYFEDEQLLRLGEAIRQHDATRPIIYDGDKDIGAATVNYHYVEGGHGHQPTGSIYETRYGEVHPYKPTGIGEFVTGYGAHVERNRWWQGTYTRGMRYLGYADIRPYLMGWAYRNDNPKFAPQRRNLANSFAPIAVFDVEYDDLGIDPLLDPEQRPRLAAGTQATRRLVLYHHAYRGERLTLQAQARSGDEVFSRGERTVDVPPGERLEFDATFPVPANPAATGQPLEWVLSVEKDDKQVFEQTYRFHITGGGAAQNPARPGKVELDPVTARPVDEHRAEQPE